MPTQNKTLEKTEEISAIDDSLMTIEQESLQWDGALVESKKMEEDDESGFPDGNFSDDMVEAIEETPEPYLQVLTDLEDKNVYAFFQKVGGDTIITPKPSSSGLDGQTLPGNLSMTFDDICRIATENSNSNKTFPTEFFRQLVACEMIDDYQMFPLEAVYAGLAVYTSIAYELADDSISIRHIIYTPEYPSVKSIIIDKEDGSSSLWVWHVESNLFSIDGEIYESQMFDELRLIAWRDAFATGDRDAKERMGIIDNDGMDF